MNGGRLRICLISEELPPETGWGGIGSYSWHIARGLAEAGHRVHVVARCWEGRRLEQIDGVEVHRLPIPEPSWRRGTWWINGRFPESRQVFLWSAAVRRAVADIRAREGLDLIESPEFHAQGLLSSLGTDGPPMVVRLHTPAFMCRQLNGAGPGGSQCDTWLSEAAERWTARRAALITSPSRALAEDVARRWRIGPDTVRVVPNPIDEREFVPRSWSSSAEPLVLYVGRLERRKGVETLIAAWPQVHAALPHARASFVGADHPSGPGGESMRAHLMQRLDSFAVPGHSVSFTGAVDRSALPAIYAAARVCVVPSLYENLPYTCLEAMACGRAVVASRVGGIPEIVTHGVDGLLVEAGSASALAGAIISLLQDEPLRRRLGARARQTVCERFSRRATLDQTVAAYRATLVGRGCGGEAAQAPGEPAAHPS
jgi:glycosyltransferase involved in cell wall biosynthesis